MIDLHFKEENGRLTKTQIKQFWNKLIQVILDLRTKVDEIIKDN